MPTTRSTSRSRRPLSLALAFASLAVSGCGDGSGGGTPTDDGANPNPLCSPITAQTATASCFLPYPSSFYEKTDAASPTGVRVSIPVGAMPKNQVGIDYDPARLNQLPGWSLSSQMVADLGVRVDGTRLVGERGDYTQTLTAASTTQIFEYATGARVPHFAEVDANVNSVDANTAQAQVVLLHPLVRLKPATRYVVVLQKLVDDNGQPIVVKPFRALVAGGVASSSRLAQVAERYAQIFALTDAQGLARADLTYAWDFTTGTDAQSWQNLVTMRDVGFARWAKDGLGYHVASSMDFDAATDPDTMRQVAGTFDVPSFLVDPTDLLSVMNVDASGNPVDTGKNFTANLLINVPQCARTATKPLPIVIYGHGNFGSRTEINSGWNKQTMSELCMVEAATDWVGQAEDDVAGFATKVARFDQLGFLFDRMQQGQLNTLVLTRLARTKLATMPELSLDGAPIVDGREVYYYGNSQGGIYGDTLMALSPDVTRGVLGVGGANYSIMIWRSRDFQSEKTVMDYVYPSLSDQQVLWMTAQNLWDRVDPIGFASHSILDPLPDEHGVAMAPKQLLLMEGRYDEQVPNAATRLAARTLGLPLLTPKIESVFGVEEKAGPLASAYTQWDVHATPPPPTTNAPADKGDAMGKEPVGTTGETVHESVRRLPDAHAMMKAFLAPNGQVVDTCGGGTGPCDFPTPSP